MKNDTIDNQQANQISWLAGLICGDGSIYVSKYTPKGYLIKLTPNIRITNMDYDLITTSANILNDNNVGCFIQERRIKSGIVYDLTVRGYKRVKSALDLLIEYLVGNKKKQAKVVLELVNLRLNNISQNCNIKYSNDEKVLYEKLRNLKASTNKG